MLNSSRKIEWEEKLETRKLESACGEKYPRRQLEWLVIITALNRFQLMANAALEVREYKQTDLKRYVLIHLQ